MQLSAKRSVGFVWWSACSRCLGHAAPAALLLAVLLAAALAANEPSATGAPAATPRQKATPLSEGPVIPAGQEDLLALMLGWGAALPGPCSLKSAGVDYAIINATYACPAGEVVFQLSHPSKAPAKATLTERFAIIQLSGSAPPGLADALAALIRSREAAFEWKWLASPPKPVSRAPVLFAAAGLLAIAVLVLWALRRRVRRLDPRTAPSWLRKMKTLWEKYRHLQPSTWCRRGARKRPADEVDNHSESATMPTMSAQLRRNPLVRHGPVTALFIMIGVCLTTLGLIGQEPVGLLAVAPLGAVLALYFRQVHSRKGRCIARSSPTRF